MSAAAPDPIDYLDRAAASQIARDYKRRLLAGLRLGPGQVVLDVGCGPGTDLAGLAAAAAVAGVAGGTGHVLGLDADPVMVREARRRTVGLARVDVVAGDAHALPLAAGSVDRARLDRVIQHLEDPDQALAELYRVVRPGGLVGLAEPDWYTLAIDDVDLTTSAAFSLFMADRVRNGAIGRQLARLAGAAGFAVRGVDAAAVLFRDAATAEQILGLERNVARAVAAGAIEAGAGRDWLNRVAAGPALATVTLFTVVAQR
jgi:ubiquinone/menaquinone biosynthesis C-methylase UbiE